VLLAACGQRPHGSGDAGPDTGGDAGDAGLDGDAAADASADAPSGVLSPEPADPASTACAGILGFPGVPVVGTTDGSEVLVEDVDGDGIRDVVVNGQYPYVARGKGNGTFHPPTSFTLPFNATSLRLADLSGDGKTDIVFRAPSSSVGSIDILQATNDGAGGFGTPQTLVTLTNANVINQFDLVDLNGDNKRDLIGVTTSGYEVKVLLRGTSSFGAPSTYAALNSNTSLQQMAIGDLSGDNRPDIVVVNGSSRMAVLLNGGTGTFGAPIMYTTPPYAGALAIVDADEDGKLDVVVGSAPQLGKTQITLLRNKGAGSLDTATTFAVGDGYPPNFVRSADVNGDGHADIGVAAQGDSDVEILLGTGTGQFAAPQVLLAGQIQTFALADLQPDGRADAILVIGAYVAPLLSRGGAQPFEQRVALSFGQGTGPVRSARIVDMNNDNMLDLVAVRTEAPSSVILSTRMATGGGYGSVSSYAIANAFRTRRTDINNDGRQDLVGIGYNASSSFQPYLNNGDGTLAVSPAAGVAESALDVAVADVNENGLRDVIVGYGGMSVASKLRAYSGYGNGQFGSGTLIWSGLGLYGVAAADLNEDGKSDVILWDEQNGLELLFGAGNGTFASPMIFASFPATFRLWTKDVNKDGHADVIALTGQGVYVMLGTGTAALGDPLITPGLISNGDAAFADVDGDDNLDAIVTLSSRVAVLLGNGDGTFERPLIYDTGGRGEMSVGDVDGDGRVDIVVNAERDNVTILYGRCL
jgi:hypothetical protein